MGFIGAFGTGPTTFWLPAGAAPGGCWGVGPARGQA